MTAWQEGPEAQPLSACHAKHEADGVKSCHYTLSCTLHTACKFAQRHCVTLSVHVMGISTTLLT